MSDINSRRTFLCYCTLGTAGVTLFNFLPILVELLTTEVGLSAAEAGLQVGSHYAMFTIIALASFIWFPRINWHMTIRMSFLCALFLFILAALWTNPVTILIMMLGMGMFGSVLYSTSMGMVALTHKQEANFGYKLVIEQLVPATLIIFVPALIVTQFGLTGLLISFFLIFVCLMVFALRIPDYSIVQENISKEVSIQSINKTSLIALIGITISFSGVLGIWAFFELIANYFSLSQTSSTTILVGTLFISAGAPFISAIIGERYGHTLPLIITILLSVLPFLLFLFDITSITLGIFMFSLILVYYAGLPYLFSLVTTTDHSGQLSVLNAAAVAMGSMIGSSLFGAILESKSPEHAIFTAFILIILGIFMSILASKQNDKTKGTNDV